MAEGDVRKVRPGDKCCLKVSVMTGSVAVVGPLFIETTVGSRTLAPELERSMLGRVERESWEVSPSLLDFITP